MTDDLVSLDELENTDTSVSKKNEGSKKFERPPMLPAGKNQVWPITGRLLVNRQKSEAKPYHIVHDHGIEVGGKFLNVPCLRSQPGGKCPFCDVYWDNFNLEKDLKAKGAESENAPDDLKLELKKAQAIKTMLKQRQRYGVLWALPKDPNVYMFFMGPALLKGIFGDADKKIAGAVQILKDTYQVPVYKAEEPVGWITCNRVGEKLNTAYSAKPAVEEVVENRKKTEKLVEEPLHPNVVARAAANDLPALNAYYLSRFWSREEMENFIASRFTAIPERYNFLFADAAGGTAPATPGAGQIETADFGGDMNPF